MTKTTFPAAAGLAALLATAAGTAAQPSRPPLDAAVERLQASITEVRHRLHQNPELGNREVATAALVADRLRALGLEVRTGVAHTGVVGLLRGGKPGPAVALRADMDALPVTEDTPLPFRSQVRTTYDGREVGVAHACGHDIHTAVMLGVASVLAPLRGELPGSVLFIFQPAEEGPPAGEEGGAVLMLKEGVFRDVRPAAVIGLHTHPDLHVGTLGYTSGPSNASADYFEAVVKGKSAHAARPQESVDPVVMAAHAVLALQAIRSRHLAPYEPSVLTVAQIHGGVRNNIIPDEVRLSGTVRLFSREAQDEVERRMREILDGVTRAAGGSFELDYRRQTPPNVSDPALVRALLPAMERVVGRENVQVMQPSMSADDFARFAAEVPGIYFSLGTLKPGTVSGTFHTPTFLADDGALPVGMRVVSHMVWDYLTTLHPEAGRSRPAQ